MIHDLAVRASPMSDNRPGEWHADVRHDLRLRSLPARGEPLARAHEFLDGGVVPGRRERHQVMQIHEDERVVIEVRRRA